MAGSGKSGLIIEAVKLMANTLWPFFHRVSTESRILRVLSKIIKEKGKYPQTDYLNIKLLKNNFNIFQFVTLIP